jgi:hypothetical protein
MPYAIVNTFLPLASDLSILGRQITLQPVQQNGAQVRPSHVVITDAEMTALEALDAADVRRVRLSMFTKLQLQTQPAPGIGLTAESQAALAAATAPTICYTHAPRI